MTGPVTPIYGIIVRCFGHNDRKAFLRLVPTWLNRVQHGEGLTSVVVGGACCRHQRWHSSRTCESVASRMSAHTRTGAFAYELRIGNQRQYI